MSSRNPSKSSKSEKERQWLQQQLKQVSSSDTAPIESPFEPSNTVSGDTIPKKSPKPRPKSWDRIIKNHFTKNSATYITLFITCLLYTSRSKRYYHGEFVGRDEERFGCL